MKTKEQQFKLAYRLWKIIFSILGLGIIFVIIAVVLNNLIPAFIGCGLEIIGYIVFQVADSKVFLKLSNDSEEK